MFKNQVTNFHIILYKNGQGFLDIQYIMHVHIQSTPVYSYNISDVDPDWFYPDPQNLINPDPDPGQ